MKSYQVASLPFRSLLFFAVTNCCWRKNGVIATSQKFFTIRCSVNSRSRPQTLCFCPGDEKECQSMQPSKAFVVTTWWWWITVEESFKAGISSQELLVSRQLPPRRSAKERLPLIWTAIWLDKRMRGAHLGAFYEGKKGNKVHKDPTSIYLYCLMKLFICVALVPATQT